MARIHGLVFVVVGLAVGITSKIVDSTAETDSMVLFFYLGIVMVVYGALSVFIFKKKKAKSERQMMYQPVQPKQQPKVTGFRYCPNCGSEVRGGNFCAACGARLK